MKPVDFWFSIGSTYSCLTVLRLEDYTARTGVQITWRPFNVREIMKAQHNVPFTGKPVKAAYMWRDIARRAQLYGLNVNVPAPYPLDNLALANQVAIVGAAEGWCEAYTVATYRLWFEEGLPAGNEPNLTRALAAIGQNPARVIALAETPQTVDALRQATSRADALGVFGAPSFVVDGEVFWGDDRLDDAVAWAREGRLG